MLGPLFPLLATALALTASPDGSSEPALGGVVQLETRIASARQTLLDSTVGLRFRAGHATGVLVSEEGHILTVAHAMSEVGRRVTVVLNDGRELDGVALGRNEHSDFGLVKIVEESEPWTWSEMAPPGSLRAGMPCLATGFPGRIIKSRGPVLRFGVIDAWSEDWLRSSCTIMPGDSGGPVFDLDGRVLGISSWIERALDANYAVPIDRFHESWVRLNQSDVWDEDSRPSSNRDRVPREPEALQLGLVLAGGRKPARIDEVLPGSPAWNAGAQPGDLIVGLGNRRFGSSQRLELALREAHDQEFLALTLQRDGTEEVLALVRAQGGRFPEDGERSLLGTAEALADRLRPATVTIHSRFGNSMRRVNGVVVDSRGYLLTKASELGEGPLAQMYDEQRFAAHVVEIDDSTDLALLKIESEDYPAVRWKTDHDFRRGQWLVSATSAPGQSANGVVSALPSRVRGSRRAYLGVRMENAEGGGALIQTVEPGTAAQRAGLRNLDVIQRFDDADIETYFDLQSLLRRARPGQAVALSVLRDDEQVELSATLGRRPPQSRGRSDRHVADTVSLSTRRSDFPMAVRHDANVNPQECGSPLLDSSGHAIGLNIARLDRTGTLALPANEILRTLEKLLAAAVNEH